MNRDFISYANSFQTVITLGLERIAALLALLGNPQEQLRCIHVAGTNGKGSVCAFLQSILTHSGYRTGLYTSPNLVRVNERITIDGSPIADDALEAVLLQIEALVGEVKKMTGNEPTQFEIWTAAAFSYFRAQHCDYVVLETGLGGTYDATNVISHPAASVITRIDLDHMQYLGDTIAQIASQKCGIIKEPACGTRAYTITGQQPPEAMTVIQRAASDKKNVLLTTQQPRIHTPEKIHEVFDYNGIQRITCPLPGPHQIDNAAIAIETARALGISDAAIKVGLESAVHPGRFELLCEQPPVIYDGAHNKNGVQALLAALDRYYPDEARSYVFASMKDKDILPSLKMMKQENSQFYFVTVMDNERAMQPEELCALAKEAGITGTSFHDLRAACEAAMQNPGITVICGSLYLYKDLMAFWQK